LSVGRVNGLCWEIICRESWENWESINGRPGQTEVLLAGHAYLCAFNMGVNINASYFAALKSLRSAVGVFGQKATFVLVDLICGPLLSSLVFPSRGV